MSRASEEQLAEWDRSAVWHAFTQMSEYEPFIIREAQGCTLVDIHGRRYLDGVSSLWCNVHGHRHPHLDAALRQQLDRVAHVTLLGASTPPTIELAQRLTKIAPSGLNHVFFSSDGAAAVEVALKLAFQYWQQRPDPRPRRTKYIALDLAYHGDTLGSVSVGGVARFHDMFRPLLFDVVRAPCPDTYRLPEGVAAEDACQHYLSRLEDLLEREQEHVAAVVLEPLIQGAAGMVAHPAGFLRGVRRLTRHYDVLLIADEVATGFGRTGTMFACQQEDVSPDLMCLGKGLTGGYLPMAATLAGDELWQAFLGGYSESRHFYHGHTYSGNALAAAVSLASLEVFEQERVLEQLPPKTALLSERLRRIAEAPYVGDTRQVGLIGAVELARSPQLRVPFDWTERRGQRVCDYARQEGVFLRPLGNVVVVMPPLCVTLDELQRILDAVERGIEHATADLPGQWTIA